MVIAAVQSRIGRRTERRHRDATTSRSPVPTPAAASAPAAHGPIGVVPGWLQPGSMAAVPRVSGEQVDAAWVERMRGPYTSLARHLLERALAPHAAGPPPPARHGPHPVPTWAAEAAAGHRGLLDALGLDLPPVPGAPPAGHGPMLVQHLVPAITLGWYLVTTVLATGDAVLLVEGTYAEHESVEAPFPVRWA